MKDILSLIQADTLVHCTVVMHRWHTARAMSQFSLQGWTLTLCIGGVESQPLDHQGKSL